MYKDDDLLKVRAKDYDSYARLIKRKVLSTQELTTSILPPGGSQYSGPPLDIDKFNYGHRSTTNAVDNGSCLRGISSFPTESNDRMKSESYRILSEIFRRTPIGFRQRGFRRNPTGSDQIASKLEYFRLNPVVFPIGLDRNPWSELSTWAVQARRRESCDDQWVPHGCSPTSAVDGECWGRTNPEDPADHTKRLFSRCSASVETGCVSIDVTGIVDARRDQRHCRLERARPSQWHSTKFPNRRKRDCRTVLRFWHPIEIFQFAVLGVILLVLMGIVGIVLLLLAIDAVTFLTHADRPANGGMSMAVSSFAHIIVVASYIAAFVLTVCERIPCSISHAFDFTGDHRQTRLELVRLIGAHRPLFVERIWFVVDRLPCIKRARTCRYFSILPSSNTFNHERQYE